MEAASHEGELSKATSWSVQRCRGIAIATFVLTSLALFGATLLGDEALFYRDVLHYYWPKRLAVVSALAAWELPLWDSTHQGGLPLLADLHAGVLYLPNLLFSVLPFPRAYALLLVLHHVLLGLGMYELSRRFQASFTGALSAGLTMMLAGSVVGFSNAGPLMAGAAVLPWVLVVIASDGPAMRRTFIVALLLAAQAVCGDPQSVVFDLLVVGAFVAWHPQRAQRAAIAALGATLAFGLAAVQLLPAWQLFVESSRAASEPSLSSSWALHPLRLIELLLPFPFGGYLEVPQFWGWHLVKGPGSIPFSPSVYLGAAASSMGLLGFGRDRRTGFLLTLLGIGLVLSLSPHLGLAGVYASVPPFKFFRYPEKYLLVVAFASALLVGSGLTVLQRSGPRLGALAGLGGSVGLLILVSMGHWLAPTAWRELLQGWLVAQGARANADEVLTIVGASATIAGTFQGLLWATWMWRARRSTAAGPAVAAVAICALDLLLASWRVVWLGPASYYTFQPSLVADVRAALPPGHSRIFVDNQALKAHAPRSRNHEELVVRRGWELATLKSNTGGAFGLEEASSYGAVELRRFKAFTMALTEQPAKMLGVLNACLAISSLSPNRFDADPAMRRVFANPSVGIAVHRNDRCLPRLFGVRRVTGVSSAREALRGVASGSFNGAVEAIVEGHPSAEFAELSVSNVEQKRGFLTAEVEAKGGPGFLVHSASYYPGWTVRIDGGPQAPALPVDAVIMGVAVPEGRHRVEFSFHDERLPFGAAMSGLAGLLVLVGLAYASTRRLRSERRSEE